MTSDAVEARPLNTSAEELLNGVSHGVGLLCAVAATPLLIVSAAARGGAADVVGGAVFGTSLVLLYLASTVYHLARTPRFRNLLQRLDHAAIFLLIAGTYTPFTLGVLGGPWGWTLFGVAWGTACVGICAKLVSAVRYPRLSTAAYLAMGWLVVIAIGPLWSAMDGRGLTWLVLGGLSYSVGVIFYSARKVRFSHFVWHLFVLGGSACHFFAALWYAT